MSSSSARWLNQFPLISVGLDDPPSGSAFGQDCMPVPASLPSLLDPSALALDDMTDFDEVEVTVNPSDNDIDLNAALEGLETYAPANGTASNSGYGGHVAQQFAYENATIFGPHDRLASHSTILGDVPGHTNGGHIQHRNYPTGNSIFPSSWDSRTSTRPLAWTPSRTLPSVEAPSTLSPSWRTHSTLPSEGAGSPRFLPGHEFMGRTLTYKSNETHRADSLDLSGDSSYYITQQNFSFRDSGSDWESQRVAPLPEVTPMVASCSMYPTTASSPARSNHRRSPGRRGSVTRERDQRRSHGLQVVGKTTSSGASMSSRKRKIDDADKDEQNKDLPGTVEKASNNAYENERGRSIEEPEDHSCHECKKSFRREFDLKRHKISGRHARRAGTQPQRVECDHCFNDFSRPDALRRHLKCSCKRFPGSKKYVGGTEGDPNPL
ncbi:hypothetical protein PUNSTDRAFT_45480 [Punctularia strigosozonata HHB-11173 SS5]|uniref:uncharacterized protein n=1 Tax=Punctularia strigosozonata (strain HHB-11173) TaxID=741275 RepID=UPI00044180B6|nr:uncharacterized protein PUNSTDRAFT_45480 [Punctularia strigosozonata HHB-11173 SS5]EIN08088.1 hypothetical protein PUNSTDRAFT_45480 [Punctularia strigosozonata HHB-11173 SS5]